MGNRGKPVNKTSELLWQDTQHQILFQLIDAIQENPFRREVLHQLQTYAEHHFMLEEAYMTALDYPSRDQHIHAHDRFRDEINQLVNATELSDASVRQSLSIFLREWLMRHVMGIDKDFERFVLASQLK